MLEQLVYIRAAVASPMVMVVFALVPASLEAPPSAFASAMAFASAETFTLFVYCEVAKILPFQLLYYKQVNHFSF